MAWNKRLTQLNDALSLLIPFPNSTLVFLDRAEIKYGLINFDGGPLTMWHNILSYADNNNQVDDLVDAILQTHPKNPYLLAYKNSKVTLQEYDLGTDIRNVEWKEPLSEENFEKITGDSSTLLPIKFLEIGLDKARSVARVKVPKGSKNELGSGFLIENNYFITNHHVISDIESAKVATIEFDYEESIDGNVIEPTKYSFDTSEGHFFTSKENDWTIIKVQGDANARFGFLSLNEKGVKKGDFVNIIQHPGGGFKQIALYHNMVMFVGDKNIQYLTDTQPGSSGSPVFNSRWEVVALHNSGGMLAEPGINQKFLRNQGINIKKVIEGINENNLR